MNSTKTLLAAALIAACTISQPVLAQVAESAPLPAHTVTLESTDLNFAFEQTTQPLQMATLSEQEMKETEGAFLNWVGGAVIGMVTYGSGCGYTQCTAAGFGYAAATGALFPVRTLGSLAWGVNASILVGNGAGIGSSQGWW